MGEVWVTKRSCSDCFRSHDPEGHDDGLCDCWCHDGDGDPDQEYGDSAADVIPDDWCGEAMT